MEKRQCLAFILSICLRRSDAIVAARTVRLQWLAEIDQTVGQGEALQRSPNRAGQIGASFHHDGDVAGAGDVESKLIALHAKPAPAGLNLWVPTNLSAASRKGETKWHLCFF